MRANSRLQGRFRFTVRRPVFLGLLLLGLAFVAAAPTTTRAGVAPLSVPLPEIGHVAGVKTAWIARHMVQNGVPMSIRAFKARMPVAQVLERYRDWLLDHGAEHVVMTPSTGVSTLGAGLGPYFVSIQGANKPGYQSIGYIVVSLKPRLARPSRQTTVPIPEAARVVSVRRYRDGDRLGESVTLVSDQPPGDMIAAIVGVFSDAGWQRIDPPQRAGAERMATLMFQRGNAYARASVQQNRHVATGGSLILIHRTRER